jgi:twitching motility protein PilT
MAQIDRLFDYLLQNKGSDLHLLQNQRPKIRKHGELMACDNEPLLGSDRIRSLLGEICDRESWEQYMRTGDLDFAYEYSGKARFRANYYFQHHGLAAVFRTIPQDILSLDDLALPPVLKGFARQKSGLILVTGPTGSGKSTTLAAVLNEINTHESRYILTIEEPIEFVHPNKKSYFCQREVGRDVPTFVDALRSATRMNFDVILVGEMRDYLTISLALSAASMGKMVLGTLHTNSAVKTVDRIIDVFPHNEQWKARNMLADSLFGVCAQILLKKKEGGGRVAANEILINTRGLAAGIREGNTSNIRNIIQSGRALQMQLMDDSIEGILKKGLIDPCEAYSKSHDKDRFKIFRKESEEETPAGGDFLRAAVT